MQNTLTFRTEPRTPAGPRVLIYAVGVSGVGQTRRAIRIAEYLEAADPHARVLVVSGVPGGQALLSTSRCTVVSPSEITDLVSGQPSVDPAIVGRLLLSLAADFEPDVFVSTTHAGLVGEVVPLLRSLRRRGCRRVLALRDIYWPPRFEQDFERMSLADFDHIVVAAPDDCRSRLPRGLRCGSLRDHLTHVGYLRPLGVAPAARERAPSFWCQVGGGRDGYALAASFLDVAPVLRRKSRAAYLSVSAGLLMSDKDRRVLAGRCASAGVGFDTWVVDPLASGRLTGGSVFSMAGYNSCVEAAWYGTPTVVCPRRARDDDEQWIRASQFASQFGNVVVSPSPNPEHLLNAVEKLSPGVDGGGNGAAAQDVFADPGWVAELIRGGPR